MYKRYQYALKKLFELDQYELASYIERRARRLGLDVIHEEDSFLLVNPGGKVLLASHLDRIFDETVRLSYDWPIIREKHGLVPIGGDDRCGVFIALQLMKEFKEYAFAFFYHEEIGCRGASDAVQLFDFSRYNCFIGLDRRGGSDLATYRLDNEELISIFELYGYSKVLGTITDVAVLAENFGIACVNLSVGFYFEHTEIEYVNFLDTLKTLEVLRNPGVRYLLSEKKFLVENQNYKGL